MSDAIDEAHELTRALLSQTNQTFQESAPAIDAEELRALAGWGFTSRNDTIAADVYLFDAYDAIQEALARLQARYAAHGGDSLLPAISHNGPLVFVVRQLTADDQDGLSAALEVASALAGEE